LFCNNLETFAEYVLLLLWHVCEAKVWVGLHVQRTVGGKTWISFSEKELNQNNGKIIVDIKSYTRVLLTYLLCKKLKKNILILL